MGKHYFESGVPPAGDSKQPGSNSADATRAAETKHQLPVVGVAYLEGDFLIADDAPAFLKFDTWMDGQLNTLVEQWSYMAPPKAKKAAGWWNRGVRG